MHVYKHGHKYTNIHLQHTHTHTHTCRVELVEGSSVVRVAGRGAAVENVIQREAEVGDITFFDSCI
jgi:hypothetical protein